MKKEFIVYSGRKLTIEWYYDSQNRSRVQEYFENLSIERKKKAFKLFRIMAEMGQIFNEEKFRYEGNQIFAFKPTSDRFLCFFVKGAKIIITNSFEKKTNKLPSIEKERALKYKKDYEKRVIRGSYYD